MIRRELRHRKVRRLVNAFLDDELDATLARRVAAHLDKCQDCGLDARTFEQVKDALVRLRPEVDPEVIARLGAFVDQTPAD